MDFITITEAAATIVTLIGALYITVPKRRGLYYLFVGSVLWNIFAILTKHWWLFGEEVFFIVSNIIGIINWKKKEIPF